MPPEALPTASPTPIVISIDVEPDGTFLEAGRKPSWRGFESAGPTVRRWRRLIERATGREAHLTWLLRMDPQIERASGSRHWVVEEYGRRLEGLARAGDEIGLHVHPYRWDARRDRWVADYGNQPWVERCVCLGRESFHQAVGHPPRCISLGDSWLNQATVQIAERLGFHYDISLLPGTRPIPMGEVLESLGESTGVRPDCSQLPVHPFRPAVDEFTRPDPTRKEGLWIIPITTGIYPWTWWRRLGRRLRGIDPLPSEPVKLGLELGPTMIRAGLEQVLARPGRPHVLLTIRSGAFALQRLRRRMSWSLKALLGGPAASRLVFSTPGQALGLLGLQPGPTSVAPERIRVLPPGKGAGA